MNQHRALLLTGAAGGIGTFLRTSLPCYGYTLRLADLKPVEGPDGAGSLVFDLADADAVRSAVRGVDAVVHLGGISLEDRFEAVLEANVRGTYHLHEAVRAEACAGSCSPAATTPSGTCRSTGRAR